MAKHRKAKRQRIGKGSGKRKRRRTIKRPRKSQRNAHKVSRSATRPGKSTTTGRKSQRKKRPSKADRQLELAVRELNRGHSLTATARTLGVSTRTLQQQLKRQHLITRKGKRWVAKDNRLRRVTVMSGGRTHELIVRGYKHAHLVGKHHHAVGQFVRTNDIHLLKPFEGQAVKAANGRRYILETDPNALHRIAALDSPPFHEVYDIVSPN